MERPEERREDDDRRLGGRTEAASSETAHGSEDRFHAFADAAPALLWVTDPSGVCTFLNRSWYDFTGQLPDDGLGFGWLDAVHPDDRDDARSTFLAANARREPFNLDFRLRRHDGAYRWVIDAGRPDRAEDGTFLGYVGSVIDIDDRKKAEEALKRLGAQAERQRHRFDTMLSSIHDLVYVFDPAGRLSYANRALLDLWGLELEQVIGKTFRDLGYSPDLVDLHSHQFEQVLSSRQPLRAENAYTSPAGDSGHYEYILVPMFGDDGGVEAIVGVTRDITQRKLAEETLRREADRNAFRVALADALRPLVDPVEIQAEAARVVGERLGACRVHYAEIVENGLYGVVHADYCNGVPSLVGRYRLDDFGAAVMDEFQAGRLLVVPDVGRDGRLDATERDATLALGVQAYLIAPLIKGERNVAVLVVHQDRPYAWSSDDIALVEEAAERTWAAVERGRAEAEIRGLNEDLEELVAQRTDQLSRANRELDAFNYSVSHDLRAPLRTVDGFAQALLEDYADGLDAQGRHYLGRVRAAAQRMGVLIDDLLRLSRLSRSELKRSRVDLGALARENLERLRERDGERRVETEVGSDLIAWGDEGLLRIALENLLDNAWKFSGERDVARIEVGRERRDGESVFFVRDNGAGFDPAHAERLFIPFGRLHPNERFSGSGIGLTMVQRIVHLHGGRVWAESGASEGATFSFALPAEPASRRAPR